MRCALSVLVSLSWLLNGCTSWQTEEVAPARYIEGQHPGKIRLLLQDSTRLTLQSPTVVGDSIQGWEPGKSGTADSLRLRNVATGEVQSLEVRHPDTGKSVLLGIGVAAGAAAVFFGTIFAVYAAECSSGCN
jgi:hypothetical protein